MNVRDSEVISGLLQANGYELVAGAEEADIVIFNTCSVRQHAEDKVWSEAGRVSKQKRKPIIGIVGCMAQNYKERIFDRAPGVDFAVGPADIDKIPSILERLKRGQPPKNGVRPLFQMKIWETEAEVRPEEIYHTGYYCDNERAYVVISEGCSNYCSYCVVPNVRGPLHHRRFQDILKEIEQAIDKGITKITLLGQNVNAYRSPSLPEGGQDFVAVLRGVNSIKGLKEFSFITSHPKNTSLEVFEAMADLEKLKKYLHLPVQSGSDKILKLMNRGYTGKQYLELVAAYRRTVKGGELTTDIIVGFPTETEEDFQDTYRLVEEVGFNAAYIFKYSPRPDTEALRLPDDVAKEEKERRHKLVLDLQKKISLSKKQSKSPDEQCGKPPG